MNKKVNLDMEVLKTLYGENKQFLIPLGVIFSSIMLFIFFILPQINGIFQKQNQTEIEMVKLSNLRESLSALSVTDEASLKRNLDIASLALPPNKDFAAILNAISTAAQATGVSLGDFEFQIGNITKTDTAPTGIPSIKISLNVSADTSQTIAFIKELRKTIPISQVAGAKSSGSFAAIEIVFYYKPFPPQDAVDPEKIRPVSSENQKIIDDVEVPAGLDLNILEAPEVTTNPL